MSHNRRYHHVLINQAKKGENWRQEVNHESPDFLSSAWCKLKYPVSRALRARSIPLIKEVASLVCLTFTLMTRPVTFSTFTRAVNSHLAVTFKDILCTGYFLTTIALCHFGCVIFQVVIQAFETATSASSMKHFQHFTWTCGELIELKNSMKYLLC